MTADTTTISSGSDDLESDNVQKPNKSPSLAECIRRDGHCKCAILTILLLACFATMAWCRLAQVTRVVVNFSTFPITQRTKQSPCDDGYFYLPIVFAISLYALYLIECWRCAAKLAFGTALKPQDVAEELARMREALPIIWWKAVSYHYVRRSRQITRIRNGVAATSTQVFYERVNRPGVCGSFSYGACGVKDISKTLPDLEQWPALRIRVTKGFAFANLDAATEFEEQRSRFFREQERRDDYIEMREGLDFLGCVNFNELHFAIRSNRARAWFVSPAFYWTASVLLLSWPARLIIQSNTCYIDYQITKLFGCNYDARGRPTSRMSTMDSSDLLANCSLAPSYSEAALMASYGQHTGDSSDSRDSPGSPGSRDSLDAVMSEAALVKEAEANKSNSDLSFSNVTVTSNCDSNSNLRLRSSISATVLSNGQLGYTVASLPGFGGHGQPADCPPGYFDAIINCRPLFSNTYLSLSRLKRSHTERDFEKPSSSRTVRTSNSSWFASLREIREERGPGVPL